MNAKELFKGVNTVLVIDWPNKEVPELLAGVGFNVVVHGGPGPEDYTLYELEGEKVRSRHVGRPPEQAQLVYSYRPLSELSQTIAAARNVGARTLWTQSGISEDGRKDEKGCWCPEEELRSARNRVQAAGLVHIAQPYIGEAVRELLASR